MSQIQFSIPKILENQVRFSKIYENVGKNGNVTSFGIDMRFPELDLNKSIKARDLHLLPGKIEETAKQWAKKYESHLAKIEKEKKKQNAEEKTEEAQAALDELNNLLAATLEVDDTVDWTTLRRDEPFSIDSAKLFNDGHVPPYIHFDRNGAPKNYSLTEVSPEPAYDQVRKEFGLFAQIFLGKRIREAFEQRQKTWQEERSRARANDEQRKKIFEETSTTFQRLNKEFDAEKQRDNEALDDTRRGYEQGEAGAVEAYCDLVLGNSQYPYYFPQTWDLEYRKESGMLVVDYQLPAPEDMPTIESYKYVQSRDELEEKPLSQKARDQLYETVIYQIAIRTLHELFEADSVNALEGVIFNGTVTSVNPATGQEETKTILSVSADKEGFEQLDLSRVDPKQTFKHLKGVSANKMVDLAAVPPVASLTKTDRRIVEGREIAAGMDESTNIAAMPWEDFEHLVREILEGEFGENGGEVHITQASADGGIDGIVFDPDPLRGGKTVIQAKRYTRTVGLSAVRDLYGTVINEGANKGILVTTADYGKDAYEFAKDKPLQLLNGSNLLHLLERHGHRVRIDLAEARSMQ